MNNSDIIRDKEFLIKYAKVTGYRVHPSTLLEFKDNLMRKLCNSILYGSMEVVFHIPNKDAENYVREAISSIEALEGTWSIKRYDGERSIYVNEEDGVLEDRYIIAKFKWIDDSLKQ